MNKLLSIFACLLLAATAAQATVIIVPSRVVVAPVRVAPRAAPTPARPVPATPQHVNEPAPVHNSPLMMPVITPGAAAAQRKCGPEDKLSARC